MKRMGLALMLVLAGLVSAYGLPPLPSCYHTVDEITAELQQIQTQYPNLARVYNIGHSQLDSLPIYAMKISDNVNIEENEPAVVFVGQVHAEEVLGVETTISNIKEILQNSSSLPYGSWINQLEMWFIPTLNPEGHNVVSSYMDVTYRKNKNDVNHNGIFDYVFASPGGDLDGVDINRNFAFNWCHGDTLWQAAGEVTEPYDYYRGEAPMSESESQAFAAFCDAQKPVFCIIWHSSRTGSLSENVYYPLNWQNIRPAPDLSLGQQIGQGVASQITKITGGPYTPSAALGRKGGVNDWMYQQYGTICLVIECSNNDIQPDSIAAPGSPSMVSVVQQNTNGVKWLLNRALSTSSAVGPNSMLRGVITDAVTGQPIQAEIIVEQRKAPWFAPRTSDPFNGSYWRPVSSGTYTLRYRKKGYADYVVTGFNVNEDSWTTKDVAMTPLTPAPLTVAVRSSTSGSTINSRVVLFDVENETQEGAGFYYFTTYPGSHRIEVSAEGFYPYIGILEVSTASPTLNLNIVLTPVNEIFAENWENGLDNWVKNSNWVTENALAMNGYALTDSWGGKGFYSQGCNSWIRTQNPISIPAFGNPMLLFDEHLYTEFVYDSVRVEVSADTLSWQTIYSNSGQFDWWHPVYISLDQQTGRDLYLRFRLTDQSNDEDLTDPGWTIDNLRLVTGSATPTVDESESTMPFAVIYPNYPNPFSQDTRIKFSLGNESPVTIDIYNLKGQKIKTLTSQTFKRGTYTLDWDGKDGNNSSVASGIYFCRLVSNDKTKTLKMVLMK